MLTRIRGPFTPSAARLPEGGVETAVDTHRLAMPYMHHFWICIIDRSPIFLT
jgi:hypothetical protein